MGLCALSSEEEIVLACLGEKPGEIRVERYGRENGTFTILAHDSAISQMVLNASGSRLATTSERGTLIRIFDTKNGGRKVIEFRRGTQVAIIHSLSFNRAGTMLCLSSSTGTIHVYSCDEILENTTSSFSVLRNWVPLAGDIWSAKQIYINEPDCISSFVPEEGGRNIIIGWCLLMLSYPQPLVLSVVKFFWNLGS
eukprot:TRINITY_DN3670_c0_g1_i9.p1 TRINITY_DN3670_c0_g1~~TRINITY_DN3670_c0_g1_i9.p1  ORF type:complete len:196 (+),score=38.38 TRINITY_DN3670_c0_g1_i9:293-880(+)